MKWMRQGWFISILRGYPTPAQYPMAGQVAAHQMVPSQDSPDKKYVQIDVFHVCMTGKKSVRHEWD
jgi:hypothetical protein